MSDYRKPPRRSSRTKPRRLPEHPVRVKVEEGRGFFLDGYWRFAGALRPHEGKIVEVSRLEYGRIEVRDDLTERTILTGSLIDGSVAFPNQQEVSG